MKIFGITGWKNTGKTGLIERLVSHIGADGLRVSTLKHAHHHFDVDSKGKDSYRHRAAGAQQVLLASSKRWALMSELRDTPEPSLQELIAQMTPVDLLLIEGWKNERHPKIETWRTQTQTTPRAYNDARILALASDTALDINKPVFDLDNTAQIADFILRQTGLR